MYWCILYACFADILHFNIRHDVWNGGHMCHRLVSLIKSWWFSMRLCYKCMCVHFYWILFVCLSVSLAMVTVCRKEHYTTHIQQYNIFFLFLFCLYNVHFFFVFMWICMNSLFIFLFYFILCNILSSNSYSIISIGVIVIVGDGAIVAATASAVNFYFGFFLLCHYICWYYALIK